jgi:hypothetical protein
MSKIAEIDLDQYKRLIAKKAFESWYKLPIKMRAYIDVEDMIQQGLIYVKYSMMKNYNPKRAKLTTFLYTGLENFYKRKFEEMRAIKRYDANDIPVEVLVAVGMEPSIEEEFDIHQHVIESFSDVYYNATERLRESMKRWFLQNTTTKVHVGGNRFKQDRKEFLKLAKQFNLNDADCRVLIHSPKCQLEVIKRMPENNWITVN